MLNRERRGDYLGGTVQIIPHITGEIKNHIYALDTPDTDVAIVEIGGAGELKSKPTQHSCKELLSLGIQPDIIVCRSDSPVPRDILEKSLCFATSRWKTPSQTSPQTCSTRYH